MAKLTINIPDDKVEDLLNAFAYVRQPAEGMTKQENAKMQIKEYMVNIYKSYRKSMEVGAIQDGAASDVETVVEGINNDAEEITVT